jgi:hypothetical protein
MHERELKMHKRFRLILRGGITLHKKCKTKLEWQEDELHNRYQASERRIEIFTAFHDSYHDRASPRQKQKSFESISAVAHLSHRVVVIEFH